MCERFIIHRAKRIFSYMIFFYMLATMLCVTMET